MARKCQITGKTLMRGNRVSHANNKTKRCFLPNLQSHRFWVASEKRWVRLLISNAGLRLVDKYGIEAVLASIDQKTSKQKKPTRVKKIRQNSMPAQN